MGNSEMKRLERVGQLLTPQQAFQLMIRELTNFQTFEEYIMSLASRPGWPAQWTFWEQIRQKMGGRPELSVEQAIKDCRSVIELLWNLFAAVDGSLQNMFSRLLLDVIWIRSSGLHAEDLRQKIELAATGNTGSVNPTPKVSIVLKENLLKLYAIRKAVTKIKCKYFNGQPFLMKSKTETLVSLVEHYERAAQIFNFPFLRLRQFHVKHSRKFDDCFGPWMVNFQELENSSEALAATMVCEWVTEAKAYQLINEGEVENGLSSLAACMRSARARGEDHILYTEAQGISPGGSGLK